MKLYLAGPMTGIKDFNFPAFNQMSARLRAVGYDVANPADNGAETGKPWGHYMRLDIAQMLTCDGVAFLDGWTNSKGARLESHIATELGMPREMAETWLRKAQ